MFYHMNVRSITNLDLDKVLEIYYKIENKTPACTLEGWTLGEVRERLSGWLTSDNHISLLCEKSGETVAFLFCRTDPPHLATVEIFCQSLDYDPEDEQTPQMAEDSVFPHFAENIVSPTNLIFTELARELKPRGIQTVNLLVNKKHHNIRLFSRFLEYGGFNKGSEFIEYEMDLD